MKEIWFSNWKSVISDVTRINFGILDVYERQEPSQEITSTQYNLDTNARDMISKSAQNLWYR